MNKIFAIVLLAFAATASAKNIVVNGTRFVYPGGEKEITVQMTNNNDRPAMVQAWLDEGDSKASPDDLDIPFTITPPVSRVDGMAAQSLRIRNIDKSKFPTDRESILYLNILEIPPSAKGPNGESVNALLTAIRSRFKFFYRPAGLGNIDTAPSSLQVTANKHSIRVNNPTPFHTSIIKVMSKGNQKLNAAPVMVSPKSSLDIPLNATVGHGDKITIGVMNDYGAIVDYNFTVK